MLTAQQEGTQYGPAEGRHGKAQLTVPHAGNTGGTRQGCFCGEHEQVELGEQVERRVFIRLMKDPKRTRSSSSYDSFT